MKHLSIWLTVLLLGGVAPTAAALDYGSDAVLLAADSNAPALPAATHDAAPGGMTIEAGDADGTADGGDGAAPGAPRTARSVAPPHASAAPHASGTAAGSTHQGPPTRESSLPATAWQSLLPGSIQ